jgi:hypothetical protein
MAQQRQSGIEISLETIKQLQKYTNGAWLLWKQSCFSE